MAPIRAASVNASSPTSEKPAAGVSAALPAIVATGTENTATAWRMRLSRQGTGWATALSAVMHR